MKPTEFGKYTLLERISHGGMAEVFRAKTFGAAGFERIVAIKLLLPTVASDDEFITMLIDEAKIAGQLSHANIAQIFDLGQIDGRYYIVQEHVAGRDLRGILAHLAKAKVVMGVPQACHIILKVCEGLDYAHNRRDPQGQPLNLVHRDISPQNVIVSYEGEVKLIDFGIAKAEGRATRTLAGLVKGKFAYMSPEQIRGLPVDRRSDVFACGILLHELLTGVALFKRDSDFETLKAARSAEIEPPSKLNPAVPAALDRIVLRALTRHVDDRYQTALALRDDLWEFARQSAAHSTRAELGAWMRGCFGIASTAPAATREVAPPTATEEVATAQVAAGSAGGVATRPELPDARREVAARPAPGAGAQRAEDPTRPGRLAAPAPMDEPATRPGGDVGAADDPETRPGGLTAVADDPPTRPGDAATRPGAELDADTEVGGDLGAADSRTIVDPEIGGADNRTVVDPELVMRIASDPLPATSLELVADLDPTSPGLLGTDAEPGGPPPPAPAPVPEPSRARPQPEPRAASPRPRAAMPRPRTSFDEETTSARSSDQHPVVVGSFDVEPHDRRAASPKRLALRASDGPELRTPSTIQEGAGRVHPELAALRSAHAHANANAGAHASAGAPPDEPGDIGLLRTLGPDEWQGGMVAEEQRREPSFGVSSPYLDYMQPDGSRMAHGEAPRREDLDPMPLDLPSTGEIVLAPRAPGQQPRIGAAGRILVAAALVILLGAAAASTVLTLRGDDPPAAPAAAPSG